MYLAIIRCAWGRELILPIARAKLNARLLSMGSGGIVYLKRPNAPGAWAGKYPSGSQIERLSPAPGKGIFAGRFWKKRGGSAGKAWKWGLPDSRYARMDRERV